MTVEEKKEELVRYIRLYQRGLVEAKLVRCTLHCLFVDILLENPDVEKDKSDFSLFMGRMSE